MVHPDGYGYSRFCELFRSLEQQLSPTMRQEYVAGDKVFVDYSGKSGKTGEIREAEIFLGVLGAPSYTFAEATWSQALPGWIGSHVRMFRLFGGVPRLIVPDNLKSGVNKASFYDPEINRTYGMMAAHYSVGVLPTRPKCPKDKATVESGVRFAQTCILGRLRNQTFLSLAEANAAIVGAVERINTHVMRRLGQTRRNMFEGMERSAFAALPAEDYEFAEWRLARVSTDYHVEFERYFYSVPHHLIRQQVDVRATSGTIEIFLKGQRIAAHQRRYGGSRFGADPGSHAQFASPIFRMVAGTLPTLGCIDRAAHRGPDRRDLCQPAASRTGLPNLPRGFRALPRHQRRPSRGRLGPRRRDRRADLQSIGALITSYKIPRHSAEPAAVGEHANLRGPGYFH